MLHPVRTFLRFAILLLAAATTDAQIMVYFTQPVDTTLASSPDNRAVHATDVSQVVERLILDARESVDMAMYNLNVQPVVDALIAAHRRGVRVRVIAHIENVANAASRFAQLTAAGIPVFANPRASSGQQPLMHNKFFVIDARPGSTALPPMVVTGSWNATRLQTFEDANNVVTIRDSAVAGAYRAEFEEMWGSSTETPDPTLSRFGASKRDNTEHTFHVDGTRVDVWFSPSDGVESHIRDMLSGAQSSAYTANLTITSSVLAQRLGIQKGGGADVRTLIENVDDQSSQYGFLNGVVDARSTLALPGQLHHKYAVIDAIPIGAGSLPTVVTGSHNWTYSANSINDENTIVIRNPYIANQFLQEFAARYREAGGTRSFGIASVATIDARMPAVAYPNPFVSQLYLSALFLCDVTVVVFNSLGNVVARGIVVRGEHRIRFDDDERADGPLTIAYTDCDGTRHAHRLVRVR